MSNDTTPPILLDNSTVPGQIFTLLRYIVATVGGYALGKGWLDSDGLEVLMGFATIVIPTAYGIYKSHVHKKQLLTVEPAVPDTLMRLKR